MSLWETAGVFATIVAAYAVGWAAGRTDGRARERYDQQQRDDRARRKAEQ